MRELTAASTINRLVETACTYSGGDWLPFVLQRRVFFELQAQRQGSRYPRVQQCCKVLRVKGMRKERRDV